MVKCLPTMQETQVPSLGQEDALEKETATHSNTLAWKIPWMEEHGRLQSMRSQSWTRLSDFIHSIYIRHLVPPLEHTVSQWVCFCVCTMGIIILLYKIIFGASCPTFGYIFSCLKLN